MNADQKVEFKLNDEGTGFVRLVDGVEQPDVGPQHGDPGFDREEVLGLEMLGFAIEPEGGQWDSGGLASRKVEAAIEVEKMYDGSFQLCVTFPNGDSLFFAGNNLSGQVGGVEWMSRNQREFFAHEASPLVTNQA